MIDDLIIDLDIEAVGHRIIIGALNQLNGALKQLNGALNQLDGALNQLNDAYEPTE
jgi:hypothetical protein